MASCKFCGRQFGSEQGVKAHLRSCQEYLKLKPLLQKQSPSRNSSISSLFHKSAASDRSSHSPNLWDRVLLENQSRRPN